MIRRQSLLLVLFLLLLSLSSLEREATAKKTLDPYKVLGVDKSASQRDIQKAFHKLSLQCHPDKNKNKGAQEKFAEINNAYDILSNEEKKKNYDLYGDENADPGFSGGNYGGGNFGGHEGYTYFTSGDPGDSRFNFRPEGWQGTGGQGNSFSFSFGGDPGVGGNSFGFGLNDIFSNFFGGQQKGGSQFGKSGFTSSSNIYAINSHTFKNEIVDQGLTWLLLFYTPTSKGYQTLESIIEDVSNSLQGAIKAGSINCQSEQTLCKDLGLWPSKSVRVFVYSYKTSESGSMVEYTSGFDSRNLKRFCQDQLPRFSKRVSLSNFEFSSNTKGNLPQVLLLSTKKDTPVIWRTLSGLYHKSFVFYDAEVHNVADETLKKLGVDSLPAVVGRLANGDVHVLKTGITIKDLKTGVSDMRALLDSFEKKNTKVSSGQAAKQSQADSQEKGIPQLTSSNRDTICGDKTTLCIIGAFRSSKAKDNLETILSAISRKTLTRRQNQAQRTGDSIRYALLDADKQSTFLKSFDKSGFRSSDKLLVAYKPRKGKFAAFTNEMTVEEVEKFVGSVLNGDIQFSKIQKKPVVK